MSKEGSTIGGLMDCVGVLTSFLLQYGAPIEEFGGKMLNNRFEPYGIVFEGHPEIKDAKSIPDYIFNWMVKSFGKNGDKIKENKSFFTYKENNLSLKNSVELDEPDNSYSEPSKFCPKCGGKMKLKGHCQHVCSCGFVDYAGCGQ